MIRGIKFIGVPVKNQDVALKFYTEQLGFKVATDQPFSHRISADAVVNAESCACAAPLTTKNAPGSDWNTGVMLRSV